MRPLVDPVSPLRKNRAGRLFDWTAGPAVLLLGLGVRLLYIRGLAATPLFASLSLDPAYYAAWARRIASGDWLSGGEVFEQSPLYAYTLALVFRLFGEGLMIPRVVQGVIGALTCGLVFLIARRAFGRPAALVAGLFAALYAPGVFYDGMIMKTSYALFLTAAMVAALLHSDGSRRALLALAGLLLGLAALTRDNLILLAPLIALWLAADVWIRGGLKAGRIREAAARVLLFAAGVTAAILPVTVRNYAVSGEPVLLTSGGGEVFFIGNNPDADGKYSPPPFVSATSSVEHEDFRREAERRAGRPLTRREASEYWLSEGLRWIVSEPGEYVRLLASKILIFLNAYELPDNQNLYHHRVFVPLLRFLPTFALLLPLACAGALLSMRRWKDLLPLYVVAGGYILTVMLFFNFARFRMPLVPVLLAFAGEAVIELPALLFSREGRRRAILATGGAALCAVIVLLPLANDAAHRGQSEAQLADLLMRAGRLTEARERSRAGVALLESVHADAGGEAGPQGEGVAPPGHPGRPPLGDSYYGVLMEAYAGRARIMRASGDLREALRWSALAVAAAPGPEIGFRTLVLHGDLLMQAGRVSEAMDPLRAARAVGPDQLRLSLLYAQGLHRLGRPGEALQIVERALDANPAAAPLDLADANYGLGLIHRDLGDLPRMRFHFREVLEKNPAHPRAAWIREVLAETDAAEGIRSLP